MKTLLVLTIVSAALTSFVVNADAYDEKERANQQQQQQIQENQQHQKQLSAINQNNAYMLRRVPRAASNVTCFDLYASIYRNESNGCYLGQSQWNGVPVQVCTETANKNFPPEIVGCHYHLANGKDCQIVRNASIPPSCL
jgi:hypothetical protein